MRIVSINEGKTAQIVNLEKGNVVIKMEDSLVIDMMSYMRALSVFEPGDATTVMVNRNGVEIKKEIIFVKTK